MLRSAHRAVALALRSCCCQGGSCGRGRERVAASQRQLRWWGDWRPGRRLRRRVHVHGLWTAMDFERKRLNRDEGSGRHDEIKLCVAEQLRPQKKKTDRQMMKKKLASFVMLSLSR
jgi:hypothetical protein